MELFELDINALSKGKKEAFFILYKKFFVALCLFAQKFSIEKEAAEDGNNKKTKYKKYSISCTKNARYSIIFLHYNHTYILLLKIVVWITFVMKKDENSVKVITVTKFIIMTLHLLTTLSKTKCTENYINF